MKLYQWVVGAAMICALPYVAAAGSSKGKKLNEVLLPETINENESLYLVDSKTKPNTRYRLENCRYNIDQNKITCDFLKKFNTTYKYQLTIPITSESTCEWTEKTEITDAKLWSMAKDTDVYKLNNEFKSYGKTKVFTKELYRAQHFTLTLDSECEFKAQFQEAKISRK